MKRFAIHILLVVALTSGCSMFEKKQEPEAVPAMKADWEY